MTVDAGSVALVVLATGKYLEFVPSLVRSAKSHVVGLARVFVLTDVRPPDVDGVEVSWLPWGQTSWPYSTLLRYRAITAYADVLRGFDHVLHVDADMAFVGPVELPQAVGVFAVQHPGHVGVAAGDLPYERRVGSRARVLPDEGGRYVAGGVQGGTAAEYLSACGTMAGWLQDDLDHGVVPLWHDESVWNRYCITYPPATVLPVEYCMPDVIRVEGARILALSKDHDRYRNVPPVVRFRRRVHRRLRRYWSG